ncbi:MAG: ectonucleotide pyrophosphatase/phosphodiesterase [Bacteroidetes bacterium]|nr:ectonucleotide pyrophosphatase/phosphodiesterase [Bacteroidota bacterium]MBU1580667.1 ectonucleotide pyrophosphatase/phosphodiesterase [Bacteroidota bacterium]MBU2558026.1 ectonucleotide pyrophosphatase/phosphodiesterase [Bacteroidota bacterium]
MKKVLFFALFISLTGLISCTQISQENKNDERILVVLSLDGFRWDYSDRFGAPNLEQIASEGVKAESMIPSFPSTTFANHYTMATGLYPDHHGILVNRFYDPILDETYNEPGKRSTVEEGKFYGGEPIWVTAEKQDVKTATFFWVGSEADVKGIRPSIWKKYDHGFPYEQRIDTVIAWLQLPEEERPRLIMWYFDEPDSSGHHFGPENDSLQPVIHRMDSLVGVFRAKLAKLPNADQVDFIVVSDHGMASLSSDRRIILDQYVDTSMIKLIDGWNPTMNLIVKDGFEDSVYSIFSKVPHLRVWKHGEAPAHLNHGTHPRTHDMTLLAEDGWSLFWSWTVNNAKGTHGYDTRNTDVHAIFYATGPSFKENIEVKPFQNIHLYPLMAHILNIEPAPVDGSFDSIKEILK